MCLAIYKPAGVHIKEEYLKNGFNNHSDGAGFSWSQDGKLHVVKGIFDVDKMIEQYNQIKDYHCLIHFRKATHGKVDESNCHPFLFNDGKLALIHNGILNIKCSIDGLSDTAHFVKLVLEPLIKRYNMPINDKALYYLVSTSIGTDKMAVMTEDGSTYIFNQEKGEWCDGVWYSNSSYKWSYSKTSSYGTGASSSYPPSSAGFGYGSHHSSGTQTYKGHKTWKNRFEEDSEGDESYLEFWQQALAESRTEGEGNPNIKTQKLPKLIGNDSSSSTVTVEEVENMSDEELAELTSNTKKENEFGSGHMMEYGWWDEEIEEDIATCIDSFNINREQAILRVFNRK